MDNFGLLNKNELSYILNNEINFGNKLVKQIENSGSAEIIKSKEEVIKICDALKRTITMIEKLLIKRHGTDKKGVLKNKSERKHVNQIFIEEKNATKIKELIAASENRLIQISLDHKLGLANEDLPIKLNLSMEKKGQTWEQYTFQNMPALALLPIITKMKNDVILTELLMLEKLASK